MIIPASELRKGIRLKIDNEPYVVTEFNFVKPGKGQALYRTKLKNMVTGSQFERSFRSVDTFETADLREKKMQYLYKKGINTASWTMKLRADLFNRSSSRLCREFPDRQH